MHWDEVVNATRVKHSHSKQLTDSGDAKLVPSQDRQAPVQEFKEYTKQRILIPTHKHDEQHDAISGKRKNGKGESAPKKRKRGSTTQISKNVGADFTFCDD
jgi:hypothetical protein